MEGGGGQVCSTSFYIAPVLGIPKPNLKYNHRQNSATIDLLHHDAKYPPLSNRSLHNQRRDGRDGMHVVWRGSLDCQCFCTCSSDSICFVANTNMISSFILYTLIRSYVHENQSPKLNSTNSKHLRHFCHLSPVSKSESLSPNYPIIRLYLHHFNLPRRLFWSIIYILCLY